MPRASRKERLNIFLMKEGASPEQVVSVDAEGLTSMALQGGLPFSGMLFFRNNHSHPPSWFKFIQAGASEVIDLSVRSAACLVVLSAAERVFAISFGASRHWIDDNSIERRFGMIVTLNCVDPDEIKSLDREEFDTVTRNTRSQTSVNSPIENFGLDIQRDLVRSVTGKPEKSGFADHVTGADNLIISSELSFEQLGDKCSQALELFGQTKYRERYPWIDNFLRVRDPILVEKLDGVLIDRLNSTETADVYLSPPSLLDTQEHRGYRYPRERAGFHDDLRLSDFLERRNRPSPSAPPSALTLDELKRSKIRHFTNDDSNPGDTFNVYDAVVFETRRDDKLYTLTRGEWFEIDQDYVAEVDSEVAAIETHPSLELPSAKKSELEGDYNARASAESDGYLFLMDKKLVQYGGGRSKMEVCDLLSPDGDFIHVKSKTKSAALSHLFAQGLNSAQAFRDKSFRDKALAHCAGSHNSIFTVEVVNTSLHSITYGVITTASGTLQKALPFFSRQSLANASRELRNMGYRVFLNKIEMES